MWQNWLSQYLQAALERGRLFVPATAPEALGWTVGVVVALGQGWTVILVLAFSSRRLLRTLLASSCRSVGLGLAAAYLAANLELAMVGAPSAALGSMGIVVYPFFWLALCFALLHLLDLLVDWRLKESP